MLTRQFLRSAIRAPAGAQLRAKPIGIRFLSFKQEDQPRIRIGSTAPNFQVDTTEGKIDFHEYIGNDWLVLFSHPADYTPVCTTELGAFSKMKGEFDKRGVKLIGLSTEDVDSHKGWIKDIEEVATNGQKFGFPIIADSTREIAFKYDMVTEEDFHNLDKQKMIGTVRSVFVIDPAKKVRLIMAYPASTGRNTAEVLRVVDALQLADNKGIATPIDWTVGQDVIIPPTVSNEDAKAKFGEFKTLKSYLRTTNLGN
ncbi:thioredoxin-like protein [Suhomyces tanzawaensis NRRL Y-17324]|uniref:Thioredoxin-like protein n=1 Tax=Suhomyces tanzawaensis NRRL Y-17324 TaxID=984487 RepID=A0A1E4SRR2_9ASCO|nr:thioredoxin-like protein [Suhomyces tanzawaensis NRRL Y-17324]ODV82185.1 thioredoxin-like protein [Suhomyces tanzawaensis NRRL Y-17324]